MPIAYALDTSLSVLVVTASTEVSFQDRAALVQQLFSDPTIPAKTPILIDVSTMTNVPAVEEITTMRSESIS